MISVIKLAERYQGRIAAYQVWNEPNLSREWGEVSRLAQLNIQSCSGSLLRGHVKTADPQAIVISAGLAPTGTQPPLAMPDTDFLQGMYDAGAAAYFDVLGVNAPGYKAPPETASRRGAEPWESGVGTVGTFSGMWKIYGRLWCKMGMRRNSLLS